MKLSADDKLFKVFHSFYHYGMNTNNDDIHAFFFLYASVDHLSKAYTETHREELKQKGLNPPEKDCDKLKFFLSEILNSEDAKEHFQTFNPIKRLEDEKKTLLLQELKKGKNNLLDEASKTSSIAIIGLFLEIEKLRNEVFHGDIDFIEFNASQKIQEAVIVLESFCNCLFWAINSRS